MGKDFDRRVLDDSWRNSFPTSFGEVNGNIEIDKGDLVILDKIDDLRNQGSSTASWKLFPFSKVSGSTISLASNRTLAKTNFFGVAAWHSDSGVTENIAVYTSGFFKYPLKNSRSIKTGGFFIPAGSGTTLYSQKIAFVNSGSTDRIGISGNWGGFQSSGEMRISTMIHPLSKSIY